MPRPRGRTRKLFDAGIQSLQLGVEVYNRPSDVGRQQASVMLVHHSLEMLLKSIVLKQRGRLRDSGDQYNYGFKKCINIVETDLLLLNTNEAAELRALDFQRDAAVHDLLVVSEDLLYYVIHGAVGLAVALADRAFDIDLRNELPRRALPVSAHLPPDIGTVIESDLETVRSLLRPGLRRGAEARARLRSLANIESAVAGAGDRPSDGEISRMAGRVRADDAAADLFPEVTSLARTADASSGALFVAVRIGKEGAPVRFAEDGEEADLIRNVNDFDVYQFSSVKLGRKLGITGHKARALAWYLDIPDNPTYHKMCRGPDGKTHPRYSQAAYSLMKEQLPKVDIGAVWKGYSEAGGH